MFSEFYISLINFERKTEPPPSTYSIGPAVVPSSIGVIVVVGGRRADPRLRFGHVLVTFWIRFGNAPEDLNTSL